MSSGSTSGTGEASRKKVWVITGTRIARLTSRIHDSQETSIFTIHPGTSSGLGRSLVNEALAHGDYVVATARNLESIRDYTTKYAFPYICSPTTVYLYKIDRNAAQRRQIACI